VKALLDGDLFAYRCSASAEHDNEHIAFSRMEALLDTIVSSINPTEFVFYLSGPTNFRYRIYPEYKANRLSKPKPKYLDACQAYLREEYKAVVSDNCEADDLMGIAQCSATADKPTVIVSLDKDLLQVPGLHYSWEIMGGTTNNRWTKDAKLQEISPITGLRNFYYQVLVGDASDNIKGATGIGPVKATKILNGLETPEELFDAVYDAYDSREALLMNGQVLWIQRNVGEVWQFPYEKEEDV